MYLEASPEQADLFESKSGLVALFGRDPGPGPRAAPAPCRQADPGAPVVAVIDDDEGARDSAAWLLSIEGYRVLSFASGDDFLRARLPERLACALLDLGMPGRSGLDVLRALSERDHAPPVIVLTGQADLPTAVAAMKLNAVDLIQKPYAPGALLDALAAVRALHEQSRAAQAAAREARALVDGLSERQRQVLAGIVGGSANKIIAWELGLSVRTVEAYRAQLFERLGARSTAEAVRIAVAAGMDGDAPAARRAA